MTAEELAEVMRMVNANRPHVTQTMNFNAPIGQQIAHVDRIEAHFDKDMGMQVVNADEMGKSVPVSATDVPVAAAGEAGVSEAADEELFHFIHPGVTEAEEVSLHQTVKRLVRQCGVQEICRFLSELAEQNKLLLPVGVKIAYYELERMGMPTSKEGFNYKTFAKYYRK